MTKKGYKSKVSIRAGGSYCFHIPKDLIDSGKVKLGENFWIKIEKIE